MSESSFQSRSPERGNALFIILIAVALLAALSFAVSQSNQGGTSGVSKERARLYASEILGYARQVSNAVTQLRLRGCDDSELSFDNQTVPSDYENSDAPADKSCHIFHSAGGALSWSVPPDGVMTTTPSPSDSWNIYGANEVEDVGTTGGGAANMDLILALKGVDLTICQQLNGLLSLAGVNDTPPDDTNITTTRFDGSFSAGQTISDEAAVLVGKKAACFKDANSNSYIFYKVLIAR